MSPEDTQFECLYPNCAQVERWLPVPGFEGSYRVSSCGRIWSVPREIVDSRGVVRRLKGGVRAPAVAKGGYLQIVLKVAGEPYKLFSVHQLVLEVFLRPRPEGMETRHLDSEPGHNCLGNLAWGTREENVADRVARAKRLETVVACPRGHPFIEANLVLNQAVRGHRSCLACVRAHSRVNYYRAKGVDLSFQSVSDAYFARIVEAAS